jgi:hypothetical protein
MALDWVSKVRTRNNRMKKALPPTYMFLAMLLVKRSAIGFLLGFYVVPDCGARI